MHITREIYDNSGNVLSTETIEIPDDFRGDAQKALAASDITAIRCVKAGVSFPVEWQVYVAALRAIVNGAAGPLPAQPEFPAGT